MPTTIEKPKGNRGGAGRGQGRKPGKKTLEKLSQIKTKEQALEIFSKRTFKMTNKILDAQMIVAIGTHKMIAVEIDDEGKKHVETIRDENRIQMLLDEGRYGQDYLIVEGTPADFRAGDAILNRALGKPTENIEMGGVGGAPLIIRLDS